MAEGLGAWRNRMAAGLGRLGLGDRVRDIADAASQIQEVLQRVR